MKQKILSKRVFTESQIKRLLKTGYLSRKGKKVAKEVLEGKHNKTRYKRR